jgi:hypothetical protein
MTEELEVNCVRFSDILRCPKMSLSARHYNKDGSCKCKRLGDKKKNGQ